MEGSKLHESPAEAATPDSTAESLAKPGNPSCQLKRLKQHSPALGAVDERIVAFLDQIAGEGEAHGILTRLLDRGEPPPEIAGSVAAF